MLERFDNECTASTPSVPASSAVTGAGGLTVGVVGELGVALVAGDDDAPARVPTRPHRASRAGDATAPVGLLGSLSQSTSARSASAGSTAAEVEVPLLVDRHRHRPQAGERAPIS